MDKLAMAYEKAGRMTDAQQLRKEAETILREELQSLRARLPADDLRLAATLDSLTFTLLAEEKFAEAEPAARECLAIREKRVPEDWQTFHARSMLGGSLLGQTRYAEAEPLLLSGYQGLKRLEDKIPAGSKKAVKETVARLVKLYEETGRSQQTAEWKQKLAELK